MISNIGLSKGNRRYNSLLVIHAYTGIKPQLRCVVLGILLLPALKI
jgi:hypothetical protein